MEPKKNNYKESIFRTVPLLFTLLGLGTGLFQYNSNHRREIRKDSYNFAFTIYQDFIEKCAVLTHYDKDSLRTGTFYNEYRDFERIYFGKLLLVPDSVVIQKATNFYLGINKFKQKSSTVANSDLEDLLYDLINTSKVSLKKIRNENEPF